SSVARGFQGAERKTRLEAVQPPWKELKAASNRLEPRKSLGSSWSCLEPWTSSSSRSCKSIDSRVSASLCRCAGNAQSNLDLVGNFVLRRTGIDSEVATLDLEIGPEDEQVSFHIGDTLRQLVLEVRQFHRDGYVLGHTFDGQCADGVRG